MIYISNCSWSCLELWIICLTFGDIVVDDTAQFLTTPVHGVAVFGCWLPVLCCAVCPRLGVLARCVSISGDVPGMVIVRFHWYVETRFPCFALGLSFLHVMFLVLTKLWGKLFPILKFLFRREAHDILGYFFTNFCWKSYCVVLALYRCILPLCGRRVLGEYCPDGFIVLV